MRTAFLLLSLLSIAIAQATLPVGIQDGWAQVHLTTAYEQPRQAQEAGGEIQGQVRVELWLESSEIRHQLTLVGNETPSVLEMAAPKLLGRYEVQYTLEGIRDGRCRREVHEFGGWDNTGYKPARSFDRLRLMAWPNGTYNLQGSISIEVVVEANESCGGLPQALPVVVAVRSFDIQQAGAYDPARWEWKGNASPLQAMEFGALVANGTLNSEWDYRVGPAVKDTVAIAGKTQVISPPVVGGVDGETLKKIGLGIGVLAVASILGYYYFEKKEEV